MNLNMDSFVNKLRQTVSQVAYQVNTSVNTIIPGNPIHRDYETLKQRCTYGCPGFVWTIHDAVRRDSSSIKASLKNAIGPNLLPASAAQDQTNSDRQQTIDKQLFTVFVFDKTQLDSISNKVEREAALEHIKRGVTQLTRLRHPAILTVHHPLEESRSSLAFVSEHVYGHLDSILKEQRGRRVKSQVSKSKVDNLLDLNTDLGPNDADYQSDSCQLDEIQIKAGLLQVSDGLKFLHNDAKLLHRNLCLDNIFVDSNNTWKIAGFEFSCQEHVISSSNRSSTPSKSDPSNLQIIEYSPSSTTGPVRPLFPSLKTLYPDLPNNIVPNWSCSAPEHSNSEQVTYLADVFSLGILSCALLGNETDMVDLSYEYGLISDTYKRGIHFREIADKLPTKFKSSIMKYAAINIDSRPSLDEYQNLAIFDDDQVRSIRDLDAQFAWDRLKKIDFLNRLRDILPKLSHQVKVNRVAKSLFNEIVNPDIMPHALPCIMIICKDSTPTEFKTKIFPHLKGPFRILEPKCVPLLLMDNLLVLADRAKLCLTEFQLIAFTLVQYLLRMDSQLQEKCFNVLPGVRKYIDDTSMSQLILPEMAKLIEQTTNMSLRVKCLECIGKMVDAMEKPTLVNKVIPIVFAIPTQDPLVVMSAVSVLKSIVNESRVDLTSDIVAGKIIPFLVPLMICKDLNMTQFDIIMKLIKSLLDRVEREQRALLAKRPQHQSSNVKAGPLVLNDFKGSNHFQVE